MTKTLNVDRQGITTEATEARAQALLDYVDAKADRNSPRRVNVRRAERRPFRTRCVIHFPARDGTTVLRADGRTCDISPHGISFLSTTPFIVNIRLRIAVILDDGRQFRLSVVVVRSRNVRGDWYLTGARLEESEFSDSET